ncbi:MAG TPA: transglutaminase domain-containing protein [Chitinophagaceae bacterium]|nr:transglutaminase domain-containing protein [Chitinophagaceae bacterium]
MPGRRFPICLILILLGLGAHAQQVPDYDKADKFARSMNMPVRALAELDSVLTLADKSLVLPEEKIRFVFTWVALNLEYDCGIDIPGVPAASGLEDILRNKRSTCSGYSGLMNYALKKIGFESVTIRGVAKTAKKDLYWQTLPRANHAWNAVKVNNEWKLLDATWASGEASENCDTVIRSFSPFYFFPEPQVLALSHLPSDSSWQLISKPVDAQTFLAWPIFHDPYYEKNVSSFSPATGILRASKNQLIRFRFNTQKPLDKIAIWSDDIKTIGPEFGNFSRTSHGYEYSYRVRESGDYFLNVSLDGRRTAIVYWILPE